VSWWIFLIVVVPLLGFVAYIAFDDARVDIGSGRLGKVLVRGRPTDRSLLPGVHYVPTFRRMMVVDYPSLELSYRAGGADSGDPDARDVERSGPPVQVTLGDRSDAEVSCSVRFRIDPARLTDVHNRFGSLGLWSAVRDATEHVVHHTLADPAVGIDRLFGADHQTLETQLVERLRDRLHDDGFELVGFTLGHIGLGAAGATIQAIARARLELEREDAEAALRVARARHDAAVIAAAGKGVPADAALRYREIDAWRDLATSLASESGVVPARPTPPAATATPARRSKAASVGDDAVAPASETPGAPA
jgi:regulator of protease activity HflC (stomatin/prohibitin superfamily)